MESRSLRHNQTGKSSCVLADEPQTTSENYTHKQWFGWLFSGSEDEFDCKFKAVAQRDRELLLDKKMRDEIGRLKKKPEHQAKP